MRPDKRKMRHRRGYVVPDWLHRRLKRRHPTVSLLWEPNLQTYALVQDDIPGQPHLITVLKERPNLDNTVRYLDRHHPSHLSNRFAVERFLTSLDESGPGEGDARDRIAEGNDRLWRALRPRVVVPRPAMPTLGRRGRG